MSASLNTQEDLDGMLQHLRDAAAVQVASPQQLLPGDALEDVEALLHDMRRAAAEVPPAPAGAPTRHSLGLDDRRCRVSGLHSNVLLTASMAHVLLCVAVQLRAIRSG